MNRGGGLLGPGPGQARSKLFNKQNQMSTGMKKMMGPGKPEGLLGMHPDQPRRPPQQQQQQPRSLLGNPPVAQAPRPGQRPQQQMQRQPQVEYAEQVYHKPAARGLLEEPVYYDQQQGVQETDQYGQQYEQEHYVEEEYVETHYETNHQQQFTEQPYAEPQYVDQQQYVEPQQYVEQQYIEQPQFAENYTGQENYRAEDFNFDGRIDADSLMEYAEAKHGLRGRDRSADSKRRQNVVANRPPVKRPLSEMPGLMDEPQMMEQQSFQQTREPRGQQRQRQPAKMKGLLDMPVKGPSRQPDIKQRPGSRGRTQQAELMNKAELQMKLLEEEKMIDLLQQQQAAVMLQEQQQQQLLQQQVLQQQQFLQQQQQQQQMSLLGSGPASIPSLFDLPTSGRGGTRGIDMGNKREGDSLLGKRRGPPSRSVDNKRARPGQQTNDRNKSAGNRDRSGDRRRSQDTASRDRGSNRSGRSNTSSGSAKRRDSPSNRRKDVSSSKPKDRKDSAPQKASTPKGSTSSHSSRDRGRGSSNRDNNNKSSVSSKTSPTTTKSSSSKPAEKTQVTVTMTNKDEEYDPANPTDVDLIDLTDNKEDKDAKKDEAKSGSAEEKSNADQAKDAKSKGDTEVKKGQAEVKDGEKSQEISLTVTVNKKGRSVNDADKEGNDKKKDEKTWYKCNVCDVRCFNEESFARHMNGQKHKYKMKAVMDSTSPSAIKSRMQAQDHIRHLEKNKKAGSTTQSKTSKPQESSCRTCETKYTGAYKDHKEVPEHKNKRKMGKHEDSKEDEDIAELVTLDTVGYEDDSVTESGADKSVNMDISTTSSVVAANSTTESGKKGRPEDEGMELPAEFDSNITVGQMFVVPVSGFFCKLCHKFYNSETSAKEVHCKTKAHYDKFKNAVLAKLKKSEKGDTDTQPTVAKSLSQSSARSSVDVDIAPQDFTMGDNSAEEDVTKGDNAATEDDIKGENLSMDVENGDSQGTEDDESILGSDLQIKPENISQDDIKKEAGLGEVTPTKVTPKKGRTVTPSSLKKASAAIRGQKAKRGKKI